MKTNKVLYWTVLAVTGLGSLGLSLWVWFQTPEQGYSWFGRFHHPMMSGFFPAMGLVFLLLIGGAVFWRVRLWRAGHGHHGDHGYGHPGMGPFADPLADLAALYAEGKITRGEFLERKAVLEEQS